MTEVNILGSKWKIIEKQMSEDKNLENCDGYCDWTIKQIVICRMEDELGNLANMSEYIKKVTRHEIVHAFLIESGLNECSGETDAWAKCEAVVDWIARQGCKIYRAWESVGVV